MASSTVTSGSRLKYQGFPWIMGIYTGEGWRMGAGGSGQGWGAHLRVPGGPGGAEVEADDGQRCHPVPDAERRHVQAAIVPPIPSVPQIQVEGTHMSLANQ